MAAILYGNLTVEIIDDHGARLERAGGGPDAPALLTLRPAEFPRAPQLRGRARESADALSALADGRPLEFHASCGYGKTTLLTWIAAVAGGRGIAPRCLFLAMDSDRVDDLLHQLVARLFSSARPVKLTPDQCAQVLGPVHAVVAIDDVSAGPEQVGYLLDVLRNGRVVIAAGRPALDRRGTSQNLAGLADEAALALIADGLARPLAGAELAAARRLVAAVKGQPLHLRQAAALVREGGHSLPALAGQAERDPEILDRLSINALAEGQRRALVVLALAAGAMVTPDVAAAIGGLVGLGASLESLHRRGLAERRDDRFGLPVCKTASYRALLLKDFSLAAAAHGLVALAAGGPSAADSQSAADAALSIVDFAAEQGDWPTVARLARAAEAALFISGRWQAWQHALTRGLAAANATGDAGAEAFFLHQLGSLACCLDDLDRARRLLENALALRHRRGDHDGADLTRHNLQLLAAPPAPRRPPSDDQRRRTGRRSRLAGLAAVVGVLALAAAGVALASAAHGSGPGPVKPSVSATVIARTSPSPSASVTAPISPSATVVTSPVSGSRTTPVGQGSPSDATVIVANVVELTQQAATTDLENQALTVTAETTSDCGSTPYGDVVTQDPAGGAAVDSGSAVTIGVCSVVTVPDVVGDTQGAATAALQNLGLTAATTTAGCGQPQVGTVLSQTPAAGDAAAPASTVTLTVCTAAITP
ncbi:MAG TPA: PASTA domain-containing protein [Trebonia sp.]|jgi:hypothetical protein|nr:PASTA domain-containing protein [Trebonia sp.]